MLEFGLFILGEIGAEVPLGEDALDLCESFAVEKVACLLADAHGVVGVEGDVGEGVPGVKVEAWRWL